MNIVVFSVNNSGFYFKTDNTLVKGSKDFFVPDIVERLYVSPSFVAKINKSAKCVSSNYAERYYNETGVGCVLYPLNLIESSSLLTSGIALSLDYSAYTSENFMDKHKLSGDIVFKFGGNQFDFPTGAGDDILRKVNLAIERITRYCTLKSGDLIFIELGKMNEISISEEISIIYAELPPLSFFIR
jgi:hypothetical protein